MVHRLIVEYRRSLKMPDAEEIGDLLFYRPVAFLFVKLLARTPLRPNHVTILSGICGLAAARMFSLGTPAALAWAGVWYALANVLDCADGQLARLQQSGSLLGRVIDGAVDYVSTAAVFIGIGLGLSSAAGGTNAWWLVAAAALSSAVHAVSFDHYQNEYISSVRAEPSFLESEIAQFAGERERIRREGGAALRAGVLMLYGKYLALQKLGAGPAASRLAGRPGDPSRYRAQNRLMIRCWSLLGPTTNRTVLIACALGAGEVRTYLWLVLLGGNCWLLLLALARRRRMLRCRRTTEHAASSPPVEGEAGNSLTAAAGSQEKDAR